MQKIKIVAVLFLLALIVIAIAGYEFFMADSLSSYTKITLTPWSYPPTSVKFGDDSYYLVYFQIGKSTDSGRPLIDAPSDPFFQVTREQTLVINQNESFRAIQGAKYTFDGLQIVVRSVNVTSNLNQLVLYIKSTNSNSEPMISPLATPTTSPLPTTIQSSPAPLPTPPYIVK
jgi:hypothetical protein